MTADQLELEFADKALAPGSVLILRPLDAVELITRAEAARLPILGLDGFLVSPEAVQPLLHESTDYSGANRAATGSWGAAREFVRARAAHVSGFEVVLGQEPVAAA